MTVYSGAHVAYVAGAGSVSADVVVLSDPGFSVKVTNVSGSFPLFFTVSNQGGACPVPSVSGSVGGTFVVPAVAGNSVNVRHSGQFGSVVQVVSTGSPSYMVEVQGNHATS